MSFFAGDSINLEGDVARFFPSLPWELNALILAHTDTTSILNALRCTNRSAKRGVEKLLDDSHPWHVTPLCIDPYFPVNGHAEILCYMVRLVKMLRSGRRFNTLSVSSSDCHKMMNRLLSPHVRSVVFPSYDDRYPFDDHVQHYLAQKSDVLATNASPANAAPLRATPGIILKRIFSVSYAIRGASDSEIRCFRRNLADLVLRGDITKWWKLFHIKDVVEQFWEERGHVINYSMPQEGTSDPNYFRAVQTHLFKQITQCTTPHYAFYQRAIILLGECIRHISEHARDVPSAVHKLSDALSSPIPISDTLVCSDDKIELRRRPPTPSKRHISMCAHTFARGVRTTMGHLSERSDISDAILVNIVARFAYLLICEDDCTAALLSTLFQFFF